MTTKKDYRTETEAEHRERMRELQEEMRAKMRAAKDRRGLILCHTGDGKGKTSAAFGMVARQLAHGHRVAVVQFIKASNDHVERLLRGPLLSWDHYGEGFTWDTQDRAADIACCRAGWARALEHMANPEVEFVLLDELNVVLQLGYLPVAEIVDALKKKRADQHVVLTGRGAPAEIVEVADLVTEMRAIKHPFDVGVQAQAGIEF